MTGQFGVWCVDGGVWLHNVFGGVILFDTIAEAEHLAAEQEEDWPECQWVVHMMGDDGQPYIPEG